jgi:hypothetical protein
VNSTGLDMRAGKKGKVHPIRDHEGPQCSWSYSSIISLTRRYMGVGGQHHASAGFPPGKRPVSHCTGGWVGPRADLDGRGKSRIHRDSIPGPSTP